MAPTRLHAMVFVRETTTDIVLEMTRLHATVFVRETTTDTVLEMTSVLWSVTKRVMEWVPLKGLG
jgi:hypothetical protein